MVECNDLAVASCSSGSRTFDHELIADLSLHDRHRSLMLPPQPGDQPSISMRRALAFSAFGTRTVRTPLASSAVTCPVSEFGGRLAR